MSCNTPKPEEDDIRGKLPSMPDDDIYGRTCHLCRNEFHKDHDIISEETV